MYHASKSDFCPRTFWCWNGQNSLIEVRWGWVRWGEMKWYRFTFRFQMQSQIKMFTKFIYSTNRTYFLLHLENEEKSFLPFLNCFNYHEIRCWGREKKHYTHLPFIVNPTEKSLDKTLFFAHSRVCVCCLNSTSSRMLNKMFNSSEKRKK